MKTFKEYFNETYAYATGRWSDFIVDKIVFKDNNIRIYIGTRMGSTIFETQVGGNGKWYTVQYSNNIEEAKHPQERDPQYTMDQVRDMQRQQKWYSDARGRGHSDKDIFGL